MYTRHTDGMTYTDAGCVRAQCVEIMFANIYTDHDWTLDHWMVLMEGFTTNDNESQCDNSHIATVYEFHEVATAEIPYYVCLFSAQDCFGFRVLNFRTAQVWADVMRANGFIVGYTFAEVVS